MKKLILIGIAVLMAAAIVSCSVFDEPPAQKPDNSEGLLIKFRSGDGRALTTPIAAAGADYYEVYFYNGTTKVRTSWGNGATGRIRPGDGDYSNVGTVGTGTPPIGRAYMFAGRNGTLLGIGVVTSVNHGTGMLPGSTINMATATEVEFTVTGLNTDVGGLLNPTAMTPPAPPNDIPGYPLGNHAASTFKIPVGTFNANDAGLLLLDNSQNPPLTAPVFLVNPNSAITPNAIRLASFDITNTDGYSLSYTAPALGATQIQTDTEALHANLRAAIIPTATSSSTWPTTPDPLDLNRVDCKGYLWEQGNSPFATISGVTTGITAGTALTFPINLTINPGTKVGLAQLSIEIPVIMFDTADSDNGVKPLTWYIRGGLNNTAADQGAAFNDKDGSLGGAIIIGVGEYNKNSAGLIIRIKPPAP